MMDKKQFLLNLLRAAIQNKKVTFKYNDQTVTIDLNEPIKRPRSKDTTLIESVMISGENTDCRCDEMLEYVFNKISVSDISEEQFSTLEKMNTSQMIALFEFAA